MLIVQHPTYRLAVTIRRPMGKVQAIAGLEIKTPPPENWPGAIYPPFWEGIKGKTGCDEVIEAVKKALADAGFSEPECNVRLEKFEHS